MRFAKEGARRRACAILLLACTLPVPAAVSAPFQSAAAASAGTPAADSARIHEAVQAALASLYAGDRGRARDALDSLVASRPAAPLPRLGRMKWAWWSILEGRDARGDDERQLRADLEVLVSLARARLARDGGDAEAHYALGEAHCTLGRLEGLRGHAWAALRRHQEGIPHLRAALAAAPGRAEPRASIGLFSYYAARAPAFLRAVGRLLGVRGDRDAGLADLRLAAERPGLQQVEAAFFLLEILNNAEDENLEALPLAQLFHARYPRHLGLRMKLADVLVALERPDVAVAVLEAVAADSSDASACVQARFLAARVLCESGFAQEALRRLEALSSADLEQATWLGPWHAYYMGWTLAMMSRDVEAAAHLERAARLPDLAGSRSLATRARARLGTARAPVKALAARVVHGTVAADHEALAAARAGRLDAETRFLADYAAGVAALRQGDAAGAIAALGAAAPPDDVPWMLARARVRLLQALLWGGRLDEARALALRLRPNLGATAAGRHVALLVATALEPAHAAPRLQTTAAARAGAGGFRLRDIGFTSVDVEWPQGGGTRAQPLRYEAGFWCGTGALPAGERRYAFRVEGRWRVTDPEAGGIVVDAQGTWSLLQARGPGFGSDADAGASARGPGAG